MREMRFAFMVAALTVVGVSAAPSAAAPGDRAVRIPTGPRVAGKPILGSYAVDTPEGIAAMSKIGMNLVLGGKEHLDPATPAGRACSDAGVQVLYHLTQHVYGKPRLLDRIGASETEIALFCHGARPHPNGGVIQLDDERIRYEASEADRLLRCTRGYGGTQPAEHRGGTILCWPEEYEREIEEVRAAPNLWGYYVLDDSPGDALSALRAIYSIVKRLDPKRVVAAGYGSAGSLCNFGPGVCDLMLIYWYPVFGSGKYDPLITSHQVQWMVAAAREQVPGIPFAGVYQTFDAAFDRPENKGKGLPSAEQLRKQIEDFVREGACGLVAFLGGASGFPGWTTMPELQRVVGDTHTEIRRTGALRIAREPEEMRAQRVQSTGYWARPKRVPGIPPAWHVALPFEAGGETGSDATHPPEVQVDLKAVYAGRSGPVRWAVRRSIGGVVGLGELLGGHDLAKDAVAYAACEVDSPRRQAVEIRYGSDDDLIVRLNGQEVVNRIYAGGLERDAERRTVTLNKGRNRLLVKVHNRTGMWGFHLRFTDLSGRPATGLRFMPQAP